MLFGQNNLSLRHSKTARVVTFFLLFWCLSTCVLFIHSLTVKNKIQQQRRTVVEAALTQYLEKNKFFSAPAFRMQADIPRELDFIRLVRGSEQLLLTNNSTLNFTGLVDVDPSRQGVWIDLLQPGTAGSWLVLSRKVQGGMIAQAGCNDRSVGLAIYLHIRSVSWYLFLSAMPSSLLLALVVVMLMEKPLRQLHRDVETAIDTKTYVFPGHHAGEGYISSLYRLLEKIFSQNRQLIQEMQSSLDNVAHDLRTPMTRLRAVAEYALQSDKEEPELYRTALSDCLEESERVLSMLKVMMSVAEAEAGTMRLELQELNVAETLADVISLYQYVAEEEQVTVSCSCDEDLSVYADKMRIRQVWANLLDNAIKYSHDNGTVQISAAQNGEQVLVSFTDNGMGISDTELNRIWDRLYRGDRSRTKQGLGLGLNFVKAVVEAHGGTVLVTSTIRKGSCFTVSLPLSRQTENHKLTGHDQKAVHQGWKSR